MTDNIEDSPDGAALLRQARETLMTELLPTLPEEARLNALMIANAMSIAARELEARDQSAEQGPEDRIRMLATEIRAGIRDGDAALHGELYHGTVRDLEISNPKALDA